MVFKLNKKYLDLEDKGFNNNIELIKYTYSPQILVILRVFSIKNAYNSLLAVGEGNNNNK